MERTGDVTRLLAQHYGGDDEALAQLMDLVYDDLHGLARAHLRRRFAGAVDQITMEPSGLVAESFLRLIRQRNAISNREQFFAIATRLMMRVLIDYARSRRTEKRGGGAHAVTLPLDVEDVAAERAAVVGIEQLAEALDALDALDPRKADVVRLRVVWNLEVDQIAAALDVSPSTVDRDWRFARAWLIRETASPGGSV